MNQAHIMSAIPKETLIQTLTILDGGIIQTSLTRTITIIFLKTIYPPQRSPGFQAQRPTQPVKATPPKSNLEKIMENFISAQTQQNKEFMNQNIHTNGLITQLGNKVDSVLTHHKMLETQISQVAQQQVA